jgi:hypothetical protein
MTSDDGVNQTNQQNAMDRHTYLTNFGEKNNRS